MLCAVSGGLDSMCLLHFLCRQPGFSVTAAHFNHQLRGEAGDADERFVRDCCAEWGVPLLCGRGDVRGAAKETGESLEEAGRRLRYAFLERSAEEGGFTAILTAHHADDNAETVLLNLLRGTGIRGLTGIPAVRGRICRPFLETSREELRAYAAAHGIPHVEDATNADPDAASRNRLRCEVLPVLRELNPRAAEHICRTAEQLKEIDDLLEADAARRTAMAEAQKSRVTIPTEALAEAPACVRPRMLLRLLDLLGAGRKDIGTVHLEAVLDLALAASGQGERQLSLPHGVTARCTEGVRLILERETPQPEELPLLPDHPIHWGAYMLTLLDHPEGEGIALRPGEEALTAGPCPSGKRLLLPGSRGSRTVKRLCIDRRIGISERDGLPAIYAGGALAAVWRLGTNVEFLPDGETCRFIQIIKETEGKDDHE